jgi:hypothetical protein
MTDELFMKDRIDTHPQKFSLFNILWFLGFCEMIAHPDGFSIYNNNGRHKVLKERPTP